MRSTINAGWLALLLVGMLGYSACDESIAEPNDDFGYEYFPLAIGQQTNYELDSIVLFNTINGIVFDTARLEAYEILMDTLQDLTGNTWYRGERYDRPVGTTAWRFRQTFLLRTDTQRAYRQEDNLEFVKMVFPVRQNQRWDGHVAFDEFRPIDVGGEPMAVFADWAYRYLEPDVPATFGSIAYDKTTTVEGADFDGLLDRRLALETYAEGIGLVYRELVAYKTQCNICCSGDTGQCLDLPWEAKAEAGFIIKQWRVE